MEHNYKYQEGEPIETPLGDVRVQPCAGWYLRIETGAVNVEGNNPFIINGVDYYGSVSFHVNGETGKVELGDVYLSRWYGSREVTDAAKKKAASVLLPVAEAWALSEHGRAVLREQDLHYKEIEAERLREKIEKAEKELEGMKVELAEIEGGL